MEKKDHIGIEVKRLDNEIHSRMAVYRSEKGQGELTMMQSWILGFIYRNPQREIFQKDIEAKFSIARSTATGILQLMEKKRIYQENQSAQRCPDEKTGVDAKGDTDAGDNTGKCSTNGKQASRGDFPGRYRNLFPGDTENEIECGNGTK